MSMADRTANTVWEGNLPKGKGVLTLNSGATGELPVTWASRSEKRWEEKTSGEGLLAAAHSSCFSMALSNILSEGGHEPERLEVTSTVSFDMVDGAPTVTTSKLTVRGRVPGIDDNAFLEAARDAEQNCPISRAIKGNVEISLDARLES
jgi:osmotically inducible protein OsmC